MFGAIAHFARLVGHYVLGIALSGLFTLIAITEFVNDSNASGWFWAFLAALVLLPGAFLAFLSVRDERDQARALAARAPTQPINVHEGGHITVNNNYAGPPHGESDQSPGVGGDS